MAEVAHVIWMKNAPDTPTHKESLPIYLPEKQDLSMALSLMSGESKFSTLATSVGAYLGCTFSLIYTKIADNTL